MTAGPWHYAVSAPAPGNPAQVETMTGPESPLGRDDAKRMPQPLSSSGSLSVQVDRARCTVQAGVRRRRWRRPGRTRASRQVEEAASQRTPGLSTGCSSRSRARTERPASWAATSLETSPLDCERLTAR